MKKTVEVLFKSQNLRETFISWFEDEGFDNFQDWVYNYCDDFDDITADFENSDQFVVIIEEV